MGAAPTPSEEMLKEYRQALEAGDARLRTIIQNNADGMLVVGATGVIYFANPAAEVLLGRKAGDLLGRVFGTPVFPGETTEIDVLRAPGDVRVAEMGVTDITWQNEPAYLASLHDVTERKRTEESLRFLNEASRVFDTSLDFPTTLAAVARAAVPHLADWCVLHLIEDDGLIRPAALAHADAARQADLVEELRRRRPTAPDAADAVARVVREGKPRLYPEVPGAEAAVAADAEHPRLLMEVGFRAYVSVPLVARGRTLGAVTLVLHESGRRYDAHDLRLAEDLGRRAALAVDNARLYEQSREAVRQRDEFLAMLAHELRNPLAPILNAAQLMHQRGLDDPPMQRARDVIERQGRQLARLLDDLLDISRITRGKIELRRKPLDLAGVLTDAVQASRPLIERRRHALSVTLPRGPLVVDADPTRLAQVFANLLNNAAKYTEPGGRIWLTADREGDAAVVRVRDTGVGIAADLLPRVFDAFIQADHSLARTQGGLGIGLTLVRSLVQMHGGRVSAHSAGPRRGSEFTVRLPLATAAAGAPEGARQAPAAFASRRILIVEDNHDSREMLRELLELWGHQVETAAGGAEGVRKAVADRPDYALIDIGLPELNGYEVARRIRAEANGPMCLVALTGYGQEEDRRRALEAGFDTHLVKPVDLDELARVLSG
jgi:signal transduction histidine kinase